MTAVTCRGLRSRISATSSLSPTRERPMALRSSLLDLMTWPLMLVMTSPGLMPAFSAAEPRVDLRHQHALGGGNVQRLGHVGRERIDVHAQQATLDRAVFQQLVHDAAGHVDRDGEADADVAAGARQDGAVDADQLAPEIHQRAAGVAGVDRGVGLDEVLVAVLVDAGAAQAADDARGDGVLQAKRDCRWPPRSRRLRAWSSRPAPPG